MVRWLMPYLDTRRKFELVNGAKPETPGDLTFLFTSALLGNLTGDDLPANIREIVSWYLPDEPRFADHAVVLGCLYCARREDYRRRSASRYDLGRGVLSAFAVWYYDHVVAPYEDTKIAENGDVY